LNKSHAIAAACQCPIQLKTDMKFLIIQLLRQEPLWVDKFTSGFFMSHAMKWKMALSFEFRFLE